MKTITITTLGNTRLTIYPVGTVTVCQHATTCTIEIYNPGGKLLYECKETAEEINAMLAASTRNPTESDIAERVRLLRKACTVIAHPDDARGLGGFHFAAYEDGPYYLQDRRLNWEIASLADFSAELERVAIRQLISERAK